MKLYDRFADKEFHSSIATTFGIDFDAYENIVLPRLRGAGCRNNIVLADSRMLTHALCGASALPRHAGRLYNISGVSAAGVFHPKLFLQAGRRRGRLIVSSANITSPGLAGNLELAGTIVCDETPSGEQQLIAAAWEYLLRLCNGDQQGLTAQLDWMVSRAPWLGKASPAAGSVGLADGTSAALLTSGEQAIGDRFADLIDEPVTRLIVISPYWDMNLAALEFLAGRLGPDEIAILIDRRCAVFPKHALHRLPRVLLYDRGEFRKGRFIHAKLLIAQTASADHVLLGSANCTLPALGNERLAGENQEACLYRRLPAGSLAETLGLAELLVQERQIDPAALSDPALDEGLPLDELASQSPGTFECRIDTLFWRPSAAFDPASSSIVLLDQQGRPIACDLTKMPGDGDVLRFQIGGTQERPAFARVDHRDGKASAPAIVTLIDRLRAAVRESSSREADKALRELEDETEASLLLMDVLNVLERMEGGESGSKEPISIPKTKKDNEQAAPEYRTLSYEEFIAGRRPRSASQLPHNSLAGSNVSVVRSFLNRIVGLTADDHHGDDQPEGHVPGNAFDLGDETADAQQALNAGEEFDTEKTRREEEERRKKAELRKAAARRATKAQIATAALSFRERITKRKASGALDNRDIFRLRALLMVICTAGLPAGKQDIAARSRLRVLPSEGDQDSWPRMLGRTLFDIFGSNQPAIRHFYLSAEHDQIPDDIVECWATCYWCLQACLTAPLSPTEQKRIRQYLKPLAEIAYRLTLPTKEELLGDDVMSVLEAMSENYGDRLGLNSTAITSSHRAMVDSLFGTTARGAAVPA